ncbi:MAG: hypothetical protein SFY32_08835 [Bacteroidota bacterium]|nr:hypothetical protein [Bacteroidota bacterium]
MKPIQLLLPVIFFGLIVGKYYKSLEPNTTPLLPKRKVTNALTITPLLYNNLMFLSKFFLLFMILLLAKFGINTLEPLTK